MGGLPKYPQFPIRVNPIIIRKMRYIANENSRSTAKEIEQLMIKHIKEYELSMGEITEDELDDFFKHLNK